MEQLFKTIDVDGNGTIDFEEFLLLFKFKQPRPCEKENTRESEDLEANEKIMRMFDQDGSGFLSPREWLQVRGLICLCELNMALTLICCSNESSACGSNDVPITKPKDFYRDVESIFGAGPAK